MVVTIVSELAVLRVVANAVAGIPRVNVLPRDAPNIPSVKFSAVCKVRFVCRSTAGFEPDELLMVRFCNLPVVPVVNVPAPEVEIICGTLPAIFKSAPATDEFIVPAFAILPLAIMVPAPDAPVPKLSVAPEATVSVPVEVKVGAVVVLVRIKEPPLILVVPVTVRTAAVAVWVR